MYPHQPEERHVSQLYFPPLDQTIHIGASEAFANLANGDHHRTRRRRERRRLGHQTTVDANNHSVPSFMMHSQSPNGTGHIKTVSPEDPRDVSPTDHQSTEPLFTKSSFQQELDTKMSTKNSSLEVMSTGNLTTSTSGVTFAAKARAAELQAARARRELRERHALETASINIAHSAMGKRGGSKSKIVWKKLSLSDIPELKAAPQGEMQEIHEQENISPVDLDPGESIPDKTGVQKTIREGTRSKIDEDVDIRPVVNIPGQHLISSTEISRQYVEDESTDEGEVKARVKLPTTGYRNIVGWVPPLSGSLTHSSQRRPPSNTPRQTQDLVTVLHFNNSHKTEIAQDQSDSVIGSSSSQIPSQNSSTVCQEKALTGGRNCDTPDHSSPDTAYPGQSNSNIRLDPMDNPAPQPGKLSSEPSSAVLQVSRSTAMPAAASAQTSGIQKGLLGGVDLSREEQLGREHRTGTEFGGCDGMLSSNVRLPTGARYADSAPGQMFPSSFEVTAARPNIPHLRAKPPGFYPAVKGTNTETSYRDLVRSSEEVVTPWLATFDSPGSPQRGAEAAQWLSTFADNQVDGTVSEWPSRPTSVISSAVLDDDNISSRRRCAPVIPEGIEDEALSLFGYRKNLDGSIEIDPRLDPAKHERYRSLASIHKSGLARDPTIGTHIRHAQSIARNRLADIRHKEQLEHDALRAANSSDEFSPDSQPTGQAEDTNEVIIDVLLPALMQLTSYRQDSRHFVRDAFSRMGPSPEWAIDHGPDGENSFFGGDWGAPPARVGRDPRYRAFVEGARALDGGRLFQQGTVYGSRAYSTRANDVGGNIGGVIGYNFKKRGYEGNTRRLTARGESGWDRQSLR